MTDEVVSLGTNDPSSFKVCVLTEATMAARLNRQKTSSTSHIMWLTGALWEVKYRNTTVISTNYIIKVNLTHSCTSHFSTFKWPPLDFKQIVRSCSSSIKTLNDLVPVYTFILLLNTDPLLLFFIFPLKLYCQFHKPNMTKTDAPADALS